MNAEAWKFAQLDEFWERYQPLSPWGRDEAQARTILVDRPVIEARLDDIDAILSLIVALAAEPSSLDRLSYHLRRMPRVPLERKDVYEVLELFQFKKFVANYRGIVSTLRAHGAVSGWLPPLVDASPAGLLARELDRSGSDPETFYMADAYDSALAVARAGIAAADEAIGAERIKAEAATRLEFGLSFDGREFVVAPRDVARTMAEAGGRWTVEPYDDTRYIVRIAPSVAAMDAMADRARFLEDERAAEARVVARLSGLAGAAIPELMAMVAAVTRLDRARAGAVLAQEFGMSRPQLDSGATRLAQARFIPCADECERLGLRYTPLTTEFGADAIVLFGSNMGGKTVVLKTLLFMQLLAQTGNFVPAARFETRVYARVEYVGELAGERLTGLSGFGLELWRLIAARSAGASGGALLAFDELARTTGSHEAEALLSAVVEAYAMAHGDRAFFATHFRGVARIPGVEYRRMRGLDRAAAATHLGSLSGDTAGAAGQPGTPPLAGRLAGINRSMRYEVLPDDGADAESDALAIAEFLGLEKNIVERARYYLTKGGAGGVA